MKQTSTFSPGRRKLLIGGASAAVALGVFGAASWEQLTNYRATWIERVVRENLPGIDLDAASLQAFIKEMLASERMQRTEVKVTVFADRFGPWLPAHISKARDGLEGLERHVLTEYLIGSNFFRVPDPKREQIVYSGTIPACRNPFVYSNPSTFSKA
ncbi:hypothetical protein [Steroidobacter agaridevorans]|uniref:hypothetical protein n=1 Tax=Steroidobacter agaridevorans TaxID=2695856 RepID=UPI0013246E16|nr:hypothetical protein [Steroidobacter agaridevorans]GFE88089.1 hypothetical protein GCM10011488_30430 [Steroidobacter agaridevorans]